MEKNNQDIIYYSFAISNFLAAIGGGMILGKGVDVIDYPLLKGSSILAFFIGTALGLIFLQIFPKKISNILTRYFSILASIASLILLYIFVNYDNQGKLTSTPAILFFSFLSIRFSLWFFSRVLRVSASAAKQKIAWVELGYYCGMIGGLIIWSLIGIELSMVVALIIDAALQFISGVIDLFNYQAIQDKNATEIETPAINSVTLVNYNKRWLWKLSISAVFLTIGTQVIIFSLAHQVSPYFATYILAFYYLGVAIAAYFSKLFKIEINWHYQDSNKTAFAIINYNSNAKNKGLSILFSSVLTALFVSIASAGVIYLDWGFSSNTDVVPSWNLGEYFLMIFVLLSSFCYEAICLSLLNRIGLEDKQSLNPNMIMRTYGFMGIGAAISLWFIAMTNSIFSLAIVIVGCFLSTIMFLHKRKLI